MRRVSVACPHGEKGGFLTAQTAFGMTGLCFTAKFDDYGPKNSPEWVRTRHGVEQAAT